jgi:3-oxoacyl-[acyl-carrier-protein] synthase II
MKRRVVITGLGSISAAGIGAYALWEAACQSKSGIGPIRSFDCSGFPVKLGGEVADFNPGEFLKTRKAIKVMSRDIQLAYAASRLAFDDAGLDADTIDSERSGVCMGAGLLDNELDELAFSIQNSLDDSGQFQMTKFGSDGLRSLSPLWMLKYLPNMPACHVSISYQLQGPSNTITTSCASAMQAAGEAFRIIERGHADLMVAGGAESRVNPIGISRYQLFHNLVTENGKDNQSYCPFDKKRSGFVVGEGAGILILEELESALKRKAKIYGELIGYGSSSDYNYFPDHMQDSQGRQHSMETALRDAALKPGQTNLIHAHGSGIPKDDLLEAQAIHRVFGDSASEIPVLATKALMGHTGFGSGAFQLILSCKVLEHQKVPVTANYEEEDPEINLAIVRNQIENQKMSTVLSNAFGLSGQNASIVLKQWEAN